jgi:hypothetical protein
MASVTISTTPADSDSFISIAWSAMDDGDYVAAFALFDCALRRAPHSLEAFAGRLLARGFMEDHSISLMAENTR